MGTGAGKQHKTMVVNITAPWSLNPNEVGYDADEFEFLNMMGLLPRWVGVAGPRY